MADQEENNIKAAINDMTKYHSCQEITNIRDDQLLRTGDTFLSAYMETEQNPNSNLNLTF